MAGQFGANDFARDGFRGPGSEAVVTRLTDALLAHAVRQSLMEADRSSGGAFKVRGKDNKERAWPIWARPPSMTR